MPCSWHNYQSWFYRKMTKNVDPIRFIMLKKAFFFFFKLAVPICFCPRVHGVKTASLEVADVGLVVSCTLFVNHDPDFDYFYPPCPLLHGLFWNIYLFKGWIVENGSKLWTLVNYYVFFPYFLLPVEQVM